MTATGSVRQCDGGYPEAFSFVFDSELNELKTTELTATAGPLRTILVRGIPAGVRAHARRDFPLRAHRIVLGIPGIADGSQAVDLLTGDFNGDTIIDKVGRISPGLFSTGGRLIFFQDSLDGGALWGQFSSGTGGVQTIDFNGDGKTDLVGRVQNTGAIVSAVSTGSSFVVSQVGGWNSGVNFGGIYGYVDGEAAPNPATGLQTCPTNYYPMQILGQIWKDWPVYACVSPKEGKEPLLDFGGMYGYVNGALTANPATGKASCPDGYSAKAVAGQINVDWPLTFCYRNHLENAQPTPRLGGFFGYVDGNPSPNPVTNSMSCSSETKAYQTHGQINVDWPVSFCFNP